MGLVMQMADLTTHPILVEIVAEIVAVVINNFLEGILRLQSANKTIEDV